MSYRNLLEVATANRSVVFKRFRDFVCRRNGSYDYSTTGIGWTLHDSFYAVDQDTISTNDWFVIYSPGEGGNDDMYFRCIFISNYIKIEGYLYWDAVTHTGVSGYNLSVNNWYIPDANVPYLYIYGDLDGVIGISRETSVSANFNPVVFGKLAHPLYDGAVATCSGALTAGAARVIDVGEVPASWRVGQKLFIRDTANIALITITAKSASTITATLATNYLAGSKLSAELGYCVQAGIRIGVGVSLLIDHAGALGSTSVPENANDIASDGAPEILNGDHIALPLIVSDATVGYNGELPNIYLRNASGMTALTVYADQDGVNFRAFNLSASLGALAVVIKEV